MPARIEMCRFEVIAQTARTSSGKTIVVGYSSIQYDCGKPTCPTSSANDNSILKEPQRPSQN